MTDSALTVLVADDEPGVADVYAMCLGEDYEVRTATGGSEALALLDETVDIAVLDRRMPVVSGDEVIAEIRSRGIDCAVVLVTGTKPDLGLVDVDFDAYLAKPVGCDEFEATIEGLRDRPTGNEQRRRYRALAAKRELIEAETTPTERGESDAYQRLIDREAAARDAVDGGVTHRPLPDG